MAPSVEVRLTAEADVFPVMIALAPRLIFPLADKVIVPVAELTVDAIVKTLLTAPPAVILTEPDEVLTAPLIFTEPAPEVNVRLPLDVMGPVTVKAPALAINVIFPDVLVVTLLLTVRFPLTAVKEKLIPFNTA